MPAGQADIGDEQIDAHVRAQNLKTRYAIRRLDGRITQIVQYLRNQHPHARFVIDDQHRLARSCLWRLIQLSARSLRLRPPPGAAANKDARVVPSPTSE